MTIRLQDATDQAEHTETDQAHQSDGDGSPVDDEGGGHSLVAAMSRVAAMRRQTLGQTGTARSLMMRAVSRIPCRTAIYQPQL